MNILELGNYIVPAYAGMVLAEQGYRVRKWHNGRDPILSLNRGGELWEWINHRKHLEERPATDILFDTWPDVVLDNFRPSTLAKWEIDPAVITERRGIVWVSVRSEVGEVSFDILAQARSWMEHAPWAPFYIGDTAAGLWLAFKALAMRGRPGHYTIGHATCLEKLVEGELVLDVERVGDRTPWDREKYGMEAGQAVVEYRGEMYREPPRDRQWKLNNLWHDEGRMRI